MCLGGVFVAHVKKQKNSRSDGGTDGEPHFKAGRCQHGARHAHQQYQRQRGHDLTHLAYSV